MKKLVFLFLLFAFVFVGVSVVNAYGGPMDNACFNEIGGGSCNDKLLSGSVKFVPSGEGSCPLWFPAGCVEIVESPTLRFIHLKYNEVYETVRCDMFWGCILDISLL